MVLKEGEDPENCDKECKKKGYLVVLFKSCWYTVTLFIAICAASVILMGIEGNHLKYTNLNKYRLREDFDKRLLEWLQSNKPRAQSLRDNIGLYDTLNAFEYHQIIEKQRKENYTMIQKIVKGQCFIANDNLKSWDSKSWGDSFMYAASIMSTVGWGVYYPPDTRLRIITLVYMIFGIPIFATMINCISGILDSLEKCLMKKKSIRKYIGDDKCLCTLQILWIILAVLIYAGICDFFVEEGRDDVLEAQLEDAVLNYSWTYFISVYYTIMTVTSIGFGDIYVYSPNHFLLNIKPVLCLFLTAFLVAFFARIFTKIQNKVDKAATKRSERAHKSVTKLRLGIMPVVQEIERSSD